MPCPPGRRAFDLLQLNATGRDPGDLVRREYSVVHDGDAAGRDGRARGDQDRGESLPAYRLRPRPALPGAPGRSTLPEVYHARATSVPARIRPRDDRLHLDKLYASTLQLRGGGCAI